jgi:hypothetical protein
MWSRRCAVRSMRRPKRMPGRAIGAEMVRHRQEDPHARRGHDLSPQDLVRPNTTLKVPVKLAGSRPAKMRALSLPRSMSASSI